MKTYKYALYSYLFSLFFTLFSGSAVAVVDRYINDSVNPADNFFAHATTGVTQSEKDKVKPQSLSEKISTCYKHSSNDKIGNMYKSLTNKPNVDKVNRNIADIFSRIDAINDKSGIVATAAYLNQFGVSSLMDIITDTDGIYSNVTGVYIELGTTLSRTEFIYENSWIIKYLKNIQKEDVVNVNLLREELNKLDPEWSDENLNRFKQVSVLDLTKNNPGFWGPYFAVNSQLEKAKYIYINTSIINKMIALLDKYPINIWKLLLKVRYVDRFEEVLRPFPDRVEHLGVDKLMRQSFSKDLGRICFDDVIKANKDNIKDIYDNILSTYKSSVISATYSFTPTREKWISSKTRDLIINKLDQLKVEIGCEYPFERENFSTLQITPDDPLGNLMTMNAFNYNYMLKRLVSGAATIQLLHNWWGYRPIGDTNTLDIEAEPGYRRDRNLFLIPLNSFIAPFFTKDDNAFNYATLGATIAHEIAHAFDINGEDFPLYVWQNSNDKKRFADMRVQLQTQYDQERFTTCNPEYALNEDVADIMGFQMTRKAYQRLLDQPGSRKSGEEGKKNMSDIQQFYYDYAQNLSNTTERCGTMDPHAEVEERINVPLKNQDEFYILFNVNSGNKMYLPPAEDPECSRKLLSPPKCRVKFW